MSRKFIATVLAASIAITSFSFVPARAASDDDVAKFLFGIATLAIIGKAIDDHDRADRRRKHEREVTAYPKPHKRKVLPRRCLTRAETAVGHKRVMRAKCLNRHFARADRLPQACRLPYWTNKGRKPGYLMRCLRDRGYRVQKN
jgi:hypothetical protein